MSITTNWPIRFEMRPNPIVRNLCCALLLMSNAAQAQVIKVPDLVTKDLYYSTASKMLYASIAASSPRLPNTIAVLDPADGSVVSSIPVGVDPGRMAASDDGEYLFVALSGDNAVQRIRLADHAVDPPFTVSFQPTDSSSMEPGSVRHSVGLKVIRSTHDTIAISQSTEHGGHIGIAVYRNGVQLPNITSPNTSSPPTNCNNLTLGATEDTLWCYDNMSTGFGLQKLHVDDQGITSVGDPLYGLAYGFGGELQFHGGLLYCNAGPARAIDPENRLILGTYWDSEVAFPTGGFAVDEGAGIIYFGRRAAYTTRIYSFDLTKFTIIGAFESGGITSSTNPSMRGQPEVFIIAGPNRLAGIDSENGQIFLFDRSLLTPFVQPPPVVTDLGGGVRALSLPNTEIAYDPNSDRIFAAVSNVPGGNSLVAVDPVSLTAGPPLWTGGMPWHMAISQDGHYLYQSILGANYIQRVDLRSFTPDLRIPVFSWYSDSPSIYTGIPIDVSSMVVLPGTGRSVAVSRTSGAASTTPENDSVVIYDDAIPRPVFTRWGYDPRADVLQLDSSGTRLFALNTSSSGGDFTVLGTSPDGVRVLSNRRELGQFHSGMVCQKDICLTNEGRVIDADSQKVMGVCPFDSARVDGTPINAVLPDGPNRRAYSVRAPLRNGEHFLLTACDLDSFRTVESATLPMLDSYPANLLFWRSDQFAFSTNNAVVTVPKTALKPVPPTPLPSPALQKGHLHLDLPYNVAAYDSVRKKLYVAVPTSAGTFGNSIATIDPASGRVEATALVGGEPVAMDLSDDGSCIYVQLRLADAVVRLNLQTSSVDLRIVLPSEPTALRVQPGHPETVVIAYGTAITRYAIALYSKGNLVGEPVPLKSAASSIEFGPDSGSVYAVVNSSILQLGIAASGLSLQREVKPALLGSHIRRAGSRFYDDAGHVIDIQTLTLVDQVRLYNATVDSETGWLYGTYSKWLYVLRIDSLTSIGTWEIPEYGLVVPCGSDSVALLTEGIDFFTFDAIAATRSLPASGSTGADGVTRLDALGASMAYDSERKLLLITTTPEAGPDGNALLWVDPSTGAVVDKLAVGNNLRILSTDRERGQTYLALNGSGRLAQIDLRKHTVARTCDLPVISYGLEYQADGLLVKGLAPLPTTLDSVVVSLGFRDPSNSRYFVAVLDECEPRPKIAGTSLLLSGAGRLNLAPDGTSVFVAPNASLSVTSDGVAGWSQSQNTLRSFNDWMMCGSLVYTSNGQVYDPASNRIVADLLGSSVYGKALVCDAAQDRLYLVTGKVGTSVKILGYVLSTLAPLGSYSLSAESEALAIAACDSTVAVLFDSGRVALIPAAKLVLAGSTLVVTSAADFRPPVAPGGLFSIFGANLATFTYSPDVTSPLPTYMGGVSVSFGGHSAPLLYISPDQINAQVPYEVAPCEGDGSDCAAADVVVRVNGVSLPVVHTTLRSSAPGIFRFADQHAIAENEDFSLNTSENPAAAGSEVIVYLTGLGDVTNHPTTGVPLSNSVLSEATFPVSATLGCVAARVTFAGLTPGIAGLAQVNLRVPESLPRGTHTLVIQIDSNSSDTVLLSTK